MRPTWETEFRDVTSVCCRTVTVPECAAVVSLVRLARRCSSYGVCRSLHVNSGASTVPVRVFFSVCACRSTARALSLGSTLLIGLIDDEATPRGFFITLVQYTSVPGTRYRIPVYYSTVYEYSRLSSSRHVSCHSAGRNWRLQVLYCTKNL